MKKCKECGAPHRNGQVYDEIKDVCFNCEALLATFWACVESINRHTPLMGKPRKIIITGYKIQK